MLEQEYIILKVFNVEFEGIDKCGKDTLRDTMLGVFPNICTYKARGVLSQYAYSKLYNRPWVYNMSEGYIKNTLIVYLDVSSEEDWLNRLKITNEIEFNNARADVNFISDYTKHRDAFIYAFQYLKNLDISQEYQDHFLYLDTSKLNALEIANIVKQRLIMLNNITMKNLQLV